MLVRHILPRADGQTQGEATRGALVFLTFNPQLAAHQFHQLFADAKAQTRAAKLPGYGRVFLAEIIENLSHKPRLNADARVLNCKLYHGQASLRQLSCQRAQHIHRSFFSKFHCIARQIQQYLGDAARVTEQHLGHAGAQVGHEVQAFLFGFEVQGFFDLGAHLSRPKADALEGHAPGFDFRQVENVVDDNEQVFGR